MPIWPMVMRPLFSSLILPSFMSFCSCNFGLTAFLRLLYNSQGKTSRSWNGASFLFLQSQAASGRT